MSIKGIINSNIRFCATVLYANILFFVGHNASAAILQINANPTTLSPGEIAELTVVVNAQDQAINSAEAKIIFPTDLLEVVSVSKNSSVFSLWVEEPQYSNQAGTLSFSAGIPTPGFSGSSGTTLSFVVKAKEAGRADIFFSDAAVRANDGFGTNVLTSKKGGAITIANSVEPVVENVPAPVSSNVSLKITSPTHSSEEEWYNDSSPLFAWKVPAGVDAVQTSIDATTSGSPRVTYSPAILEKSVEDLSDGAWYFKARARKDGVWGPTSTYIARIDTAIPEVNSVVFSYNDQEKVLNIDSDIVDETSGLDYYEVLINDVLIKKIPSSEFVDGKYNITVDTPGNNVVKLVAVDRAGNSVELLGTFTVAQVEDRPLESVPSPTLTKQPIQITIGSLSIPALKFAVVLVCGLLVIVLGAFKLGRHYSKFRKKHTTRTALAKGDNAKVLLSFKKRLEKHLEILQRTRHYRTLSKEEKEIKEAIEIDLDEVDKVIEEQRSKVK